MIEQNIVGLIITGVSFLVAITIFIFWMVIPMRKLK